MVIVSPFRGVTNSNQNGQPSTRVIGHQQEICSFFLRKYKRTFFDSAVNRTYDNQFLF